MDRIAKSIASKLYEHQPTPAEIAIADELEFMASWFETEHRHPASTAALRQRARAILAGDPGSWLDEDL